MTIQGVTISWPVLAPIVVLTVGGLLIMIVDLASRAAPRALLYGIGVVACMAAFATMLPLYGQELTTLNGALASDRFSWTFDALLLVTLTVTFLLSSLRKAEDGGNAGAYAALLIFATIGGFVMTGASNLIIIFLGIEQLSLALYRSTILSVTRDHCAPIPERNLTDPPEQCADSARFGARSSSPARYRPADDPPCPSRLCTRTIGGLPDAALA